MRSLVRFICVFALTALVIPALAQDEDLETVTRVAALRTTDASPLDTVAFSPDRMYIATGGRDNAVRLWDVATEENISILAGHSDWVTSIAFNHDGTILASGSRDNTIWLWDVEQGISISIIEDHEDDITSLVFTHDGQVLISGSRDAKVRLHHLESQQEILMLDNYSGAVWDIALSPDGTTLAIAGEAGTIWLWGLWDETGLWLKPLYGHTTPVINLAFSPDGSQILSGGQDGLLRLWDIEDAATQDLIEPLVMHGHLAPIMGVEFTADGQIAISSSLDGTVRLWDAAGIIEQGKELISMEGNGAPLTQLALNPDATVAVSAGTDGVISVWDVQDETITALLDSYRPPPPVIEAPPPATVASTQPNTVPISGESTVSVPAPISGRHLSIPSANINVGITSFYLDGASWGINPWEPLVGHLQGTSWLDNIGNVALGGHSEYPNGTPGIFKNLYNVNIGDEVTIHENGAMHRYIVTDIRVVDYTDVSVVYPTEHNRLTLITCDIPSFQPQSGLYAERLVVIADKVA